MNTPIYNKVIEIMKSTATESERESALQALIGTEPEKETESDRLAELVSEIILKKLGLEPHTDIEKQEEAKLAKMYPSMTTFNETPDEEDDSTTFYPSMRETNES